MTKKNVILIGLVVLMQVAAGLILYYGLFNKGNLSALTIRSADVVANQQDIIKILPYGSSLDFSIVEKRTPRDSSYDQVATTTYTSIDPNEVGIDPNKFIQAQVTSGSR